MHKLAVSLHFGFYNLVRKHASFGEQMPAQAAAVEGDVMTLRDVVN